MTTEEQLEIYRKAINKIEDYLEYSYSSDGEKTRNEVMEIIDDITEKIKEG